MPYIDQALRDVIDRGMEQPNNPGQLNYVLTQVVKAYIERNELSYQTINDIVGALEGCKLEFYRRVVAPYENDKIEDNGDVY